MRQKNNRHTLTEITLLDKAEFLHLEKRVKHRFDYPLHCHTELELNFIEHYEGIRRVVGDSVEDVLGEKELVLVGSGLEHCWEEGEQFHEQITDEITIQFSPGLFHADLLANPHMASLEQMLRLSQQGICFNRLAIDRVLPDLRKMVAMEPGFYRLLAIMRVLYVLAEHPEDYRTLASESFSRSNHNDDTRRIEAVTKYIAGHFQDAIRLETLAELVYMSPSAFSHFFKEHTHKTVSDYIIDIRIGHASRLLIDTDNSILDICYASGFQNLSNFNRQFLKRRKCTPSDYRTGYQQARKRTETHYYDPLIDAERDEIHPKKG